MRLELKIIKFFNHLETKKVSISNHTNKYLVNKYYEYIGFTKEKTMNEWFIELASNKYKPYTEVLSAIKRARNYEQRWKRKIE